MVVLVVEKASASLRGELSRWLIEPRSGLFVGNVSAMVREKLWEKVVLNVGKGKMSGALLLHTAQTEQGFAVRSTGETSRELREYDGLTLIFVRKRGTRKTGYEDRFAMLDTQKEEESEDEQDADTEPGGNDGSPVEIDSDRDREN